MKRPKLGGHLGHNRIHAAYAITCEEYEQLVRRSEGRCDRCGVTSRRLVIDHDHALGRRAVRGLLCGRCNIILGKVDRGIWQLDELTATYHLRPFHRHIPADRPPRVYQPGGRPVARQSFRYEDDDRWHLFIRLTEAAGGSASDALRHYVDWYTRKPKAKMPTRPAVETPPADQ